jgi:PPOX class probable F420-dependent enzyme
MPLSLGPRIRAFLDEVFPAIVATPRNDGTVIMTPLWFNRDGDDLLINGGPNRRWLRRMQRDKRLSLMLMDPRNMWRFAMVTARPVEITAAGADDHIERLSQRYTGGPYRNPKIDRLTVRLRPERIRGHESGKSWDIEPS